MGLKKDVVSEQFKGKKKKDLNILHRAENIARIRSMALEGPIWVLTWLSVSEVDLVEAEKMAGLGVARPIDEALARRPEGARTFFRRGRPQRGGSTCGRQSCQ
jgi:hypothetical protein